MTEEYQLFESDPDNKGFYRLEGPARYSQADAECVMYVIHPWNPAARVPALVFVQGSAWEHPDVKHQLPQLCALAREKDVAVATVVHRDRNKGHHFPAFLEDVKCAIRYLRHNAEAFHIDPDRLGIWGTSSGGNAALLAGLTADAPEYKTDEYSAYSDGVKLVVDCFGPANLFAYIGGNEEAARSMPLIVSLAGDADAREVAYRMSPALLVKTGVSYPPALILGGDGDTIVPFSQSEEMYRALRRAGSCAELVRVSGAEHEGSFWSRAVLERIFGFIEAHI